jgi:hypothetical protein
MGRNGYRIE